MKRIKYTYMSGIMVAVLLLSATACADGEPAYEDRETFRQETYVALEDTVIAFQDGIIRTAYSAETSIDEWLKGCSAPDRNDQFDAYTLRHEASPRQWRCEQPHRRALQPLPCATARALLDGA